MPSTTVIALDLLAHELRNGANVVIGGAQLLAGEPDADVARDIESSGRMLASLIDRLIEVARSEIRKEANDEAVEAVPLAQLCELALNRLARLDPDVRGQQLAGFHASAGFEVQVRVGAAERAIADAIHLKGGPSNARATCHQDETHVQISISGPISPISPAASLPGRHVLLQALANAAGGTIEVDEGNAIAIRLPGGRVGS